LYQIPEMESMPFMMLKLVPKEMNNRIPGTRENRVEPCCFSREEEHCKSTEKVYRCNSSGKGGIDGSRF